VRVEEKINDVQSLRIREKMTVDSKKNKTKRGR
jgi:hypothetical protein